MRAFIVRPFGEQQGVDFDRVERTLIQPALALLKTRHGVDVAGATTGEITRQGNIREDMFRLLVVSDLVIADVSIHNANVFYELGIRHALQDRHTFLMRCHGDKSKYPFDLQTDRYFLYDPENPGAGVEDMAQALRATLANKESKDSPVFLLLPNLKPHPRSDLITVPLGFQEDADRARVARATGDLRLLAYEAKGFDWAHEGLRLVGDAQFRLRAFRGARETFEALRAADADDLHANQRLATIYQRLARETPADREALLATSDQAIRRVLKVTDRARDRVNAYSRVRSDAYSLLGSNAKTRWIDDCLSAPREESKSDALRSPHLRDALNAYIQAVQEQLDDHYPAINVLSLLKCQLELARALPEIWEASFDDAAAARAQLEARERTVNRLNALLELALGSDPVVGRPVALNEWGASSEAELQLLARPNSVERVRQAYRKALNGADRFSIEATRRNLEIFRHLGLFEPNASAALDTTKKLADAAGEAEPPLQRVVLFTGHMIDAPGRPKDKARFPPTPAAEETAHNLIREALLREAEAGGISLGIAGGACGGDILFHEACAAAGIPGRLFLALPPDQFLVTSVQRGGPDWVERYRRLCDRLPPRVLQGSEALPDWLAPRKGYDVWQRNNLWMMFNALATGARNLTLLTLYNPDIEADGAGGTAHLVGEAAKYGFKTIKLDARALLRA